MIGDADVLALAAGLFMSLVGLVGLVAKALLQKDYQVFKYTNMAGAVGALLVPLSFALALAFGRLQEFTSALMSAPIDLISSLGTGEGLDETCEDGACTVYCCRAAADAAVIWKDCREDCGSARGQRGFSTGATCQFSRNRPAVCTSWGATTKMDLHGVSCNHLGALGPITCNCCIGTRTRARFWDGSAGCSSNAAEPGFLAQTSVCMPGDPVFQAGAELVDTSESTGVQNVASDN